MEKNTFNVRLHNNLEMNLRDIKRISDKNHCSPKVKSKWKLFKRQGGTFIIIDVWWKKYSKNLIIHNHKKAWKAVGNKPRINFHTNGGKRKNGDWCLDVKLTVGYTIINYTNFDLQRRM